MSNKSREQEKAKLSVQLSNTEHDETHTTTFTTNSQTVAFTDSRVINHFASKLLQGLVDTQDVITNHAWRSD